MSCYETAWLGTTAIVLAAIATVADRPAPLLVWNSSPSAPRGLYLVHPGREPGRGHMAIARVPKEWRQLAARRGYIPYGVPLVKHIAAVAGNRVCAVDNSVTIDGHLAASRLTQDRHGRPLAAWHGCVILKARELLLLNWRADSFDGRYFGVTEPADLIGEARIIWRD